jgi:hypothetical protein
MACKNEVMEIMDMATDMGMGMGMGIVMEIHIQRMKKKRNHYLKKLHQNLLKSIK